MEALKICFRKTTVCALEENRPATMSVASKVLFFLALGREVLFEHNRPSNLDTIFRGLGHSTYL